MANKKNHIIARTYLKHFSPLNDGKSIQVLHLRQQFNPPKILQRNSGDKDFWEEKFYWTKQLQNPKSIEYFLGTVENSYNSIVEQLNLEVAITERKFKTWVFQWVLYSKLRSPSWREFLKFSTEQGMGRKVEEREVREKHLQFFAKDEILDFFINYYYESTNLKKWRILISPDNYSWLTSDNPGFCINSQEFKADPTAYFPNALWTNLQNDTILYFPLTSHYCLEICPYKSGDDPTKNFANDTIDYERCSFSTAQLINNWTVLTANNLVISKSRNELIEYENALSKNDI